MKRIAYICVILLCSISFAFAQGAKPGRTNTNSKKVVKKTVVSPFAEAEKAWIPFWNKFREIVKQRNEKGLKEIVSNDFVGIDWESFAEYSNIYWERLEGMKTASSLLKKGDEISCRENARTLSKVSPFNWNIIGGPERNNGQFLLFEFRRNRWFFVAIGFCEQE